LQGERHRNDILQQLATLVQLLDEAEEQYLDACANGRNGDADAASVRADALRRGIELLMDDLR
jgi:hypothetical protein